MLSLRNTIPLSYRYVLLVAALVLIAKAAFLVMTPMRGLASTTWIIDDSLIEMRIAQNIAEGNGFSLDGIHPTTGAPFLWIYLSSINHVFLDRDAAIRFTLFESAVFGALAAIVVFALALKLSQNRRIAWTAYLLATFTGNAFFNAINGMDTAIFTLFVLMTIAAYFNVGRPTKWSPFAWGSVTGICAGLTCMTRGDGIFVVGAIGAYHLWEIWNAKGEDRKDLVRTLGGMILTWTMMFAVFMGWQLIQTGSPFPANQVGRRGLSLAWHNFSFDEFSLSRYIQIVVWNVFQLEELLRIAMGSALLALVALAGGFMRQDLRRLSIITIIYSFVFFLLLVAYQWYFADFHGLRYINPATHLFFIFIAALLWQLPDVRYKTTVVTLLTLSVITVATYKHYQLASRLPWAKYMSFIGTPNPELNKQFWEPIDWMRDNLPKGTVVGIRDYGRSSMFTEIAVQDLAGNIDPEAAHALKDGTLDEYLKQRNVEYLYIPSLEQRQDYLYQYLHKELRLEQVKEVQPSPFQTLYKIIW